MKKCPEPVLALPFLFTIVIMSINVDMDWKGLQPCSSFTALVDFQNFYDEFKFLVNNSLWQCSNQMKNASSERAWKSLSNDIKSQKKEKECLFDAR